MILTPSFEHHKNKNSPRFCSGIDVGGVKVCTSANISVINKIFIHILLMPLKTLFVECRWPTAQKLSFDLLVLNIVSRCHLILKENIVQ